MQGLYVGFVAYGLFGLFVVVWEGYVVLHQFVICEEDGCFGWAGVLFFWAASIYLRFHCFAL